MANSEFERIPDEAEAILNQADSERDRAVRLDLPYGIVADITDQLLTAHTVRVIRSGTEDPEVHPEAMLTILANRFRAVLAIDQKEIGRILEEQDQTVSLDLTAREIDYLNGRLLTRIAYGRSEAKRPDFLDPDSDPSGGLVRKGLFDQVVGLDIRGAMGSFMRLNEAFVRAGGTPRQGFLDFPKG